jgi:hypothetical protein
MEVRRLYITDDIVMMFGVGGEIREGHRVIYANVTGGYVINGKDSYLPLWITYIPKP